jgi:hypothetical protein
MRAAANGKQLGEAREAPFVRDRVWLVWLGILSYPIASAAFLCAIAFAP